VTRQRRAAGTAAPRPGAGVAGSGSGASVAGSGPGVSGPVRPGAQFPARLPGVASPALVLDALGKKCPIPIIMLADKIREIPVGQTIEVLADDPAAKSDLPAWCALKSQEFVSAADLPVGWSFLVRRSY
jgi:tRNA 2-thiouridine synthesizing protein A